MDAKQPLSPLPLLSVILDSEDLERHAAFYTDVLGFYRLPEPTIEEHGLVAVAAGTMFLGFRPTDEPPGEGGVTVYILLPELKSLRDQIRTAGVAIESDIAELPWGVEGFTVRDPMGYRILFGAKIGPHDTDQPPDDDPEATLAAKKAAPSPQLGDIGGALDAVFSDDKNLAQQALVSAIIDPLMAMGSAKDFETTIDRIQQRAVRNVADLRKALRDLPPELAAKLADQVVAAQRRLDELAREEEEEQNSLL